MSWNHRIIHSAKDEYEAWEICEVYYDEAGKPFGYCDATVMASEVDNADGGYAQSLRKQLGRMMEALDKPVLEADDFHEPRQNSAPEET